MKWVTFSRNPFATTTTATVKRFQLTSLNNCNPTPPQKMCYPVVLRMCVTM